LEVRRDFKSWEDIGAAVSELAPRATLAVIEFVAARPGQSVVGMFSFGQYYGVALEALRASGVPWVDQVPQNWQRWIKAHLGEPLTNPCVSTEFAIRLFPDQKELFSRVKDHNTADACLMAYFIAHSANDRLRKSSQDDRTKLPDRERLLEMHAARIGKSA